MIQHRVWFSRENSGAWRRPVIKRHEGWYLFGRIPLYTRITNTYEVER